MAELSSSDAFVGRRHAIERVLVCAMAGQFPVLARAPSVDGDDLAIVFRAGAAHYGLTGTLATARSADGGRTWSDPIEVAPRGDDVRNPAFGIAGDGRWVLAYWQAGMHAYPSGPTGERAWRLPDADPALAHRAADLFTVASADHGRTWTTPAPYRSELLVWASPFGRIVTATDGTLVMAAYGPPRAPAADPRAFTAIIVRSADGGATWGDESRVLDDASELALCPLPDGALVGAVRRATGATAIVRSADGGRTWGAPIAATRTGEHPADVLALRGSGELLLTFGRRRRPLGCGALVSRDHGATWATDREVILAGDGVGNDVGYPSTVQLADGTLATALYFAAGSGQPWGDTTCQLLRYPASLVT